MEVVRKGCPVSNSTAVFGKLVLTLVPTNGSTMYPVKYRRGEHSNIPLNSMLNVWDVSTFKYRPVADRRLPQNLE